MSAAIGCRKGFNRAPESIKLFSRVGSPRLHCHGLVWAPKVFSPKKHDCREFISVSPLFCPFNSSPCCMLATTQLLSVHTSADIREACQHDGRKLRFNNQIYQTESIWASAGTPHSMTWNTEASQALISHPKWQHDTLAVATDVYVCVRHMCGGCTCIRCCHRVVCHRGSRVHTRPQHALASETPSGWTSWLYF